MPIIHYHAEIRLLVSVRGHPFDRTAFDAIFQDMEGVSATMVDQPAAARLMNLEDMQDFDALVLYDMPGLDFEDPLKKPGFVDPDPALVKGFEALLQEGKGIVALHHSLAGWPTWPEYGDWLGGRFLYRQDVVHGKRTLDSGYAHDVDYVARNVAPDHPVMRDIPESFPICDELYLAEIFEPDVTPLLRSGHDFIAENFYSATAALNERMYDNENWVHPPGSDLIGWAKKALNSRLVYLQPGDSSKAYENPHYRKILRNAIDWVTCRT
ncbi:ThuA domain-containing protein [Emcibacter sp.]|uniref:ThuA domain-containing protein n=1 Tax=Emcibacter sp. TaxID=1979954 RepID=UPI002AA8AAFC|nr:ThuA domain-containing protein [Emcibacter sp.]